MDKEALLQKAWYLAKNGHMIHSVAMMDEMYGYVNALLDAGILSPSESSDLFQYILFQTLWDEKWMQEADQKLLDLDRRSQSQKDGQDLEQNLDILLNEMI